MTKCPNSVDKTHNFVIESTTTYTSWLHRKKTKITYKCSHCGKTKTQTINGWMI
jgi:hypothetical protein